MVRQEGRGCSVQGQKAAWNVADGSQVSTCVGILRHSKPDGKRKTARIWKRGGRRLSKELHLRGMLECTMLLAVSGNDRVGPH